ncbi:AlpA family phage regulatory protein [Paracoccus pantotrophus]|uniref:AlpA family phage regulatory protein n=2 Tax=Paracoccus pantotrophus TaxID=82367 RepID=A0AAE6NYQ6_PARPN|nr:AlpA family phage regulatory protein [Paracoccus pantotrophus]QFG37563.1 AlpA family phage regulatory protein [Paracoccus pantotrophus]
MRYILLVKGKDGVDMLERHIGTAELCKRIGVGRVTIYRWLKDEAMKFPKPAAVGGKHFWPESVIADYFAQARGAA